MPEKTKDRSAIYQALGEMRDKLSHELQVNQHDDVLSAEVPNWTMVRPGKSLITAGARTDGNGDALWGSVNKLPSWPYWEQCSDIA